MLAVVATSLLRARLGRRAWRAVHWLAYASWPVAVLHGVKLGNGTGHLMAGWMLWLTAGCVGSGTGRRPIPSDGCPTPFDPGLSAGGGRSSDCRPARRSRTAFVPLPVAPIGDGGRR